MSEITVTFTTETAESIATGLAELEAEQKIADERAAQRQVILDRLGITADEAALLLG